MCNKYIIKWSGSEDSSQYNPYLCAHFLCLNNVPRGTLKMKKVKYGRKNYKRMS